MTFGIILTGSNFDKHFFDLFSGQKPDMDQRKMFTVQLFYMFFFFPANWSKFL